MKGMKKMGKKPANQGKAGKAFVQAPKKQDAKASSKGGSVMFGKQSGGTRGSAKSY